MKTALEELLAQNGYIVYKNKGISMLPLIRENRDLMYIRAKKSGFMIGDAVLFKRDSGEYVLHRIIRAANGGYYIRGDNCIYGEFVRNDQILGILEAVFRDEKEIKADSAIYKAYCRTVPARHFALRAKRKLKKLIK